MLAAVQGTWIFNTSILPRSLWAIFRETKLKLESSWCNGAEHYVSQLSSRTQCMHADRVSRESPLSWLFVRPDDIAMKRCQIRRSVESSSFPSLGSARGEASYGMGLKEVSREYDGWNLKDHQRDRESWQFGLLLLRIDPLMGIGAQHTKLVHYHNSLNLPRATSQSYEAQRQASVFHNSQGQCRF